MRSVAPKGEFDAFYVRNLQLPICGRHLSLHCIYVSDCGRFHHETGGQPSSASWDVTSLVKTVGRIRFHAPSNYSHSAGWPGDEAGCTNEVENVGCTVNNKICKLVNSGTQQRISLGSRRL